MNIDVAEQRKYQNEPFSMIRFKNIIYVLSILCFGCQVGARQSNSQDTIIEDTLTFNEPHGTQGFYSLIDQTEDSYIKCYDFDKKTGEKFLFAEGELESHSLSGEWKFYNIKGEVQRIESYQVLDSMIIDTIWVENEETGRFESHIYKRGIKLKDGVFSFYRNGVLIEKLNYKLGKQLGIQEYFDEKGRIIEEELIEDGSTTSIVQHEYKNDLIHCYGSVIEGDLMRADTTWIENIETGEFLVDSIYYFHAMLKNGVWTCEDSLKNKVSQGLYQAGVLIDE